MSILSRPVFMTYDPDEVTQQLVELYEQIVGKALYPAQPERLFVDVIAYRECLIRQAIQEAAEQNLVAYARDVALDHLAQNVGVTRLPAQPASCTVRITLSAAAISDTTIPHGVLLKTNDGLFDFETSEDCTIAAGDTSGTCGAVCATAGPDANGYLAGSLSLGDPVDGVVSATNITATADGSDTEEDDVFRARIPLALEAYSCAGPALAYRYWAMSAHNSILDVSVVSPSAGVVQIYPLTREGAPSQHVMDLVAAAVSDDKRRPLTDQVQVLPPQAVHFSIDASLILYGSTDRASVLAKINQILAEYQKTIGLKMGRDIVPSQLSALIHIDGVYSVTLTTPELIQVDSQSYAVLDSWTINVGGVIYE